MHLVGRHLVWVLMIRKPHVHVWQYFVYIDTERTKNKHEEKLGNNIDELKTTNCIKIKSHYQKYKIDF